MIDNRHTFTEHLTYIGGKCVITTCALSQIMPKLRSPKQEEIRLLMKVVTASIRPKGNFYLPHDVYCCSINDCEDQAPKAIVDVERIKHNTRRRTDILNRVQLVDDTMDIWQQDRSNSTKRKWTYRLIPSISEWP